jgi:hypothetical protein
MITTPTTVAMLLPVLCTVWGIQQDETHTYWATASHCVPAVGQVVVIASPKGDGKRVEARVVAKDPETDTAVLKTWTAEVGTIEPAKWATPRPGLATVASHRGKISGEVLREEIAIAGLTNRQLATARVIPGDSGSSINQTDGVIGVVTHSVNGCATGFCPTPQDVAARGVTQPLVNGDPLGISIRDLIAAIAGYFGLKWFNTPKQPPTP